MKFLHLSDLHITADDAANEPIRQRIGYIRTHYPDHFVVVTGDVVDNEGAVVPGTPLPIPGGNVGAVLPTALQYPPPPLGDITPHLQRLQTALQKAHRLLGTLSPGRLFLCAGNHDYGLWGNLYSEHYIKAFDDFLFTRIDRGNDGAFVVITTVLSSDLSVRPLSAAFPISYVISARGEPPVALLGLNTIGEPATDPTRMARGILGGDQLAAIQRYFFGATFMPGLGQALGIAQLCFFHHHPWIHDEPFMKLVDADQLLAQLRNKVDLIMFGHRHRERRYEAPEIPNGGLRYGALAAGSSREETHAWQVDIASVDSWRFARVPIV